MPTILVVDDDQQTRRWLCHVLESKGYQVEEACNGKEALAAIERLEPALVVLDLFMPEVDGMEVLLSLRSRLKHFRILVLSGNPIAGLRTGELAKMFGANDIMNKPVDSVTFLQHVERLLSRS